MNPYIKAILAFLILWVISTTVIHFGVQFFCSKDKPTLETLDPSIEQIYDVKHIIDEAVIEAKSATLYPTKIHLHDAKLTQKKDDLVLKGEMVIIDRKTKSFQFPKGMTIEEIKK